ncbi:MAG: multiheme c-type cytochrome [Terracidiphilus sp.]
MKFYLKLASIVIGSMAVLAVTGSFGASYYYTTEHGRGCASCHEMAEYVSAVHSSLHRNQNCMDCHEASLATKLRHIRVHLMGNWPEEIRLRDVDVVQMTTKCQNCHQHEYASWQAGPHSATYGEIFTNAAHNGKRALMNDCFRCHGMHYNGSVRDLVQPQSTQGPWRIVRAGFADQPTMPCQTCHWVHRTSAIQAKPNARISVAAAPIQDSLAFFDRRESMHFAAASLSLPQLHDGARLVKVSQDPRQGICYQCHAPRIPETGTSAALNAWGTQVGSGDDRTPMGVHEGISCFSCHNGHNENARASCKTCHPQMSHCGLDVEKMDTTFVCASSAHNIHWVKCVDCHQHGVPQLKPLHQ